MMLLHWPKQSRCCPSSRCGAPLSRRSSTSYLQLKKCRTSWPSGAASTYLAHSSNSLGEAVHGVIINSRLMIIRPLLAAPSLDRNSSHGVAGR